jgi:hypothetical protein
LDKKLFFIAGILRKVLTFLDEPDFIRSLPEEFFNALSGYTEICQLDLHPDDLEQLQIFIYYARLIGGLEITVIKSGKKYFFINLNGTYENTNEENFTRHYSLFINNSLKT